MVLRGRSVFCYKVPRKVLPRFHQRLHQGFTKVAQVSLSLWSSGAGRLGLLKGSADGSTKVPPCLTHTNPVRRKRSIMSLLLGYSLGLFIVFSRMPFDTAITCQRPVDVYSLKSPDAEENPVKCQLFELLLRIVRFVN